MPTASLHLVQLRPSTISPAAFLTLVHQFAPSYRYTPLVTSTTHHWVSRPQHTGADALSQHWQVLVVLQPSSSPTTTTTITSTPAPIPSTLIPFIATSYTLTIAIPRALLADYASRSAELRATKLAQFNRAHLRVLQQAADRQKATSQALELSPELLAFAAELMRDDVYGDFPVTMLNLLRFNAGEPGRQSYIRYGKAFSEDVGRKRGGNAKIVGKVVGGGDWDEVAIVHYPNIVAFCDMAAGEDYQEANARWRLPALKDTVLLCTTEVLVQGGGGIRDAKL